MDLDAPVRGVTPRQVLEAWERVITVLGNPPIDKPMIVNVPNYHVHFGITLDWEVVLNLASVPPDLGGSRMIKWLENFPITHEIGHYVFCPYDGITHAKLGIKVERAWKSSTEEEILYMINIFSDIIINNDLYKIFGESYFKGMKKWIEFTIVKTFENGFKISASYLIFTMVHELLWNRRFFVFNYPREIHAVAVKVADVIMLSPSWYSAIEKITMLLKDTITKERSGKADGAGTDALTKVMLEKMRADLKGKPLPGSDPEGGDNKADAAFDFGAKAKKEDAFNVPFDMSFYMGDPFSKKTIGNVNKARGEEETRDLVDLIEKMDIPFSSSFKIMRFMGVAETKDHAWRLWLRAKARGMIKYETKATKRKSGGFMLPSGWDWDKPLHQWNVLQSVASFPLYPFFPFAKGEDHFKGIEGTRKLPRVRDILIARDSSASMSAMMKNGARESWTRSVKITHKVNNKFNLSSLACFAALHAAAQKGAWFSVVNFSSAFTSTEWMKPGKKTISAAERMILFFQNHGTTIPVDEIGRLIEQRSKCFVLIITDGYLHNWSCFLDSVRAFKNKDHEIAMIFISDTDVNIGSNITSRIERERIKVHFVSDPKSLFATTLKEVDRVYD